MADAVAADARRRLDRRAGARQRPAGRQPRGPAGGRCRRGARACRCSVLGAMTEGQLGSLLDAGAARAGVAEPVSWSPTSWSTPADPAFGRPTKPIGPFLTEAEAARGRPAERGWTVGEDAGRGYRRLVASPRPLRIVELDAVRALVRPGPDRRSRPGGGGVPVVRRRRRLPGHRRGDRQGPRRAAAGHRAGRGGARAGHRRAPGAARLRHPERPPGRRDDRRPGAVLRRTTSSSRRAAWARRCAAPSSSCAPGGRLAVITNAERASASLGPARRARTPRLGHPNRRRRRCSWRAAP